MKLVLDTNIIHEDFFLNGARISKLCSAAPALGYELLVPEVVCDEMVNQYRKKLLKNISGYAAVVKMTNGLKYGVKGAFEKDTFIEKSVEDYRTVLMSRLNELDIQIIAYPRIDAKKLVSKDLLLKKPFRVINEESVGLRDALIWESVKSVCIPSTTFIKEPQVEFITANTKDFACAENTLHPDLVDELKEVGLKGNSVELISAVDEFFTTKIDVELGELENIRTALLKTGTFNRFDMIQEATKAIVEDFLNESLLDSDYDSGSFIHLPGYCEDPTIGGIYEPTIEEVCVRRLFDQTVLIEVKATVLVDMDFFVFKADYYLIDEEKRPYIVDANWNEHYYWVEDTAHVTSLLSFRTTAKLGKIISQDVLLTNVFFCSNRH